MKVIQELTTCGKAGSTGPSQANCDAFYGPGKVVVKNGYQLLTVAKTGSYQLNLTGARGGNHGGGKGGFGARAIRTVSLKAGDKLIIVIGQKGWDNPSNGDWGGGGGGGTFVAQADPSLGSPVQHLNLKAKLIAAAGGGAGLNDRRYSGQALGGRAEEGDPATQALGGHSEGGAGFQINGRIRAKSFLNGAAGGWHRRNDHAFGGFGGGGAPYNGGGGGGGYDGGDCTIGGTDHDCYGGSSLGDDVKAAVNSGHGKLVIAMQQ